MHLGQSPKGILIGIAQLVPVDGRRGNYFAEVFRNIPFIAERAVRPTEHVAW
jgi:hypothetical protein